MDPETTVLERIRAAQDAHGSYDQALQEIANGKKRGHWICMWSPTVIFFTSCTLKAPDSQPPADQTAYPTANPLSTEPSAPPPPHFAHWATSPLRFVTVDKLDAGVGVYRVT